MNTLPFRSDLGCDLVGALHPGETRSEVILEELLARLLEVERGEVGRWTERLEHVASAAILDERKIWTHLDPPVPAEIQPEVRRSDILPEPVQHANAVCKDLGSPARLIAEGVGDAEPTSDFSALALVDDVGKNAFVQHRRIEGRGCG